MCFVFLVSIRSQGFAPLRSRDREQLGVTTVLGRPNAHTKYAREVVRSESSFRSTVEEGSALVTAEARGSGCVLLVSEAAGALCTHMVNALVHRVGDTQELARHVDLLEQDRTLLKDLRAASLETADKITWAAAGARLYQVYCEAIQRKRAASAPSR